VTHAHSSPFSARRDRAERWLFLTPEMERLAPGLIAALAPAAGERTTVDAEEARLDELVRWGSAVEWFAELRRCRTLLEAAARGGAADALVHRFALVLLEQYLLAPAVVDPVPAEDDELARLRSLVRATTPTPAAARA
jgi:hypothetical protein